MSVSEKWYCDLKIYTDIIKSKKKRKKMKKNTKIKILLNYSVNSFHLNLKQTAETSSAGED